ncbi:uncharacterized protein LOC122875502 isoform X2 [Siniperca chuatsi]|uniref:uncharacterized protein LOC122875502 isoform X2 n=1 Tax=Siniperca chuatsi TaxID=119488 RepID=UPI001CE0F246|nr:uncharacterized protein LOC122875502 isoform X2 [Siniperca chuatsi]
MDNPPHGFFTAMPILGSVPNASRPRGNHRNVPPDPESTPNPRNSNQLLDIQEQGSLSLPELQESRLDLWRNSYMQQYQKQLQSKTQQAQELQSQLQLKGRQMEAENEALMECNLEWRAQSAAQGRLATESTQVGHRCKDLEAQLGQRPTSVIQYQDMTQDTRSRSEEKIMPLHAELSNMAVSISRYSAPNCSDLSQQNHTVILQGVAPSGGRGSAAGAGPVRGQCSLQEITAREQRVTTLDRDPEAAHSQTTERKQLCRKGMDYCIRQRWIYRKYKKLCGERL